VPSRLLAAILIVLSLSGCDLLKDKKERSREKDCEEQDCPKCPSTSSAGAGASGSPREGLPGLCESLGSFAAATDAARALTGDVELNRGGVPLADAETLSDAVRRDGGAETAEPMLGINALLVRGKQQSWSVTLTSLPKAETRRKDLGRFVTEGRLPEASTTPELAIGKRLAIQLGAKRGDELTVAALPNAAAAPTIAPSVRTAKIVGILDMPGDPVVDYETTLALMESEDIRTIGLVQPGYWAGVRIWYKQGERAAGVLKLQDALRGHQMVSFLTLDQSLAGLSSLRPTLEAVCAGK
jgi:ABC-type lipoprotein release transport system permease subunit